MINYWFKSDSGLNILNMWVMFCIRKESKVEKLVVFFFTLSLKPISSSLCRVESVLNLSSGRTTKKNTIASNLKRDIYFSHIVRIALILEKQQK